MKTQGVIGAVLLAAGGMCPLVHVPVLGNWNYFKIDPVLGTVFYVITVLALAGALLNRTGLMKFAGWAAVIWAILTLCAVWFKSHDYFSFMHFKGLIGLAAGVVHYKWGWFVIIAGALILIAVRKPAAKAVVVSAV
jgi:hypothetical protein